MLEDRGSPTHGPKQQLPSWFGTVHHVSEPRMFPLMFLGSVLLPCSFWDVRQWMFGGDGEASPIYRDRRTGEATHEMGLMLAF